MVLSDKILDEVFNKLLTMPKEEFQKALENHKDGFLARALQEVWRSNFDKKKCKREN